MSTTLEITKAELKKLFFSPVSWLILIIFSFQVTVMFNGCMANLLRVKGYGNNYTNLTHVFYASGMGFSFFSNIQGYLYLYIPLLTMNILSRDLGSGTINLLYASPVTNIQIILGKYLSLVIFGFILLLVVIIEGIYAGFQIEHTDWPLVFNGIAGLFLLICSYAAVGVLMSSLTNYPIVAAITTFAVLAFLGMVGHIGQEIPIVRDITYWFAITGRSSSFIWGMISTESVVYFMAFISFFLSLSMLKLHAARRRQAKILVLTKYMVVVAVIAGIGYFSSLPTMMKFLDVTRTQSNTLSQSGQDILKKIDDDLTVTTYSNMLELRTSALALPSAYKRDVERFALYTRFKPDIRFNYQYYYKRVPNNYLDAKYANIPSSQLMDTIKRKNDWSFEIVSYEKLSDAPDLAGENFRFVRVLQRSDGRKAFLRVDDDNQYPTEDVITAALKRLVQDMPLTGVVIGHGERSITQTNETGYNSKTVYKSSFSSLINHGFDFSTVNLNQPVPEQVGILLIADLKEAFNAIEMQHFHDYIARGGNVVIAAEPGKGRYMNPILSAIGVQMLQGSLVQPKEILMPGTILSDVVAPADSFSYLMRPLLSYPRIKLIMKTATALNYDTAYGFTVTELFRTDSYGTWLENDSTSFGNDTALFNPEKGEVKRSWITALGMSRMVQNKKQQIIVTSDADWLCNGEIIKSVDDVANLNYTFFVDIFYKLSDGEAPIDVRKIPPIDNKVLLEKKSWKIVGVLFKWVLPLILLISCSLILIRRKGR